MLHSELSGSPTDCRSRSESDSHWGCLFPRCWPLNCLTGPYHPWLQLPWSGVSAIVCQVKFWEEYSASSIFHNFTTQNQYERLPQISPLSSSEHAWSGPFPSLTLCNQHYYSSMGRLVIVSDFLSCLKYLMNKTWNICRRVGKNSILYPHHLLNFNLSLQVFLICFFMVIFANFIYLFIWPCWSSLWPTAASSCCMWA